MIGKEKKELVKKKVADCRMLKFWNNQRTKKADSMVFLTFFYRL